MITPSFSLTATERVLPKLALDFTTASLDPRIAFTRALNTATRINSSGLVETVNANVPRFDYNPTTLVCRGLLIEESRTNVLLRSQALATSPWSNANLTSITNNTTDVTDPSGNNTATKIVSAAANGAVLQNVTLAASTYGASIWLRCASGTMSFTLTVYLATSPFTGIGSTTVNLTTTWQRFSIVTATATAAGYNFQLANIPTTSAVYAWGAQLEAGAFVTSYIPTTSGSVLRNADVAVMTGTNFSNWWQATTGATAVNYTTNTVSGTRPIIQFDDNTADNLICLRGNTTNPELYIKATTDQAQIDAGTVAANTTYILAGAWNTNNCAAAISGNSAVTDTSATIPTVSQTRLGCDGTNYLNGFLRMIRYWPQRLTNAEIQAFSK